MPKHKLLTGFLAWQHAPGGGLGEVARWFFGTETVRVALLGSRRSVIVDDAGREWACPTDFIGPVCELHRDARSAP